MIDPELYYRLWQQEHGEQVRQAARRQAVRDSRTAPSSNVTHRMRLGVLHDLGLRLRSLWTIRRPAEHR
ncbi:hypothetical protein [Candidatus Nephthysia bennettiae]|uniref:Uncharacterized protein n=1 Tax=Candidatus Nephthysia bennettiae TaxID=3127016 RepID=A0A934KAC9_9BACT|nr:hypothetical protein [Candidatus Dormibacteraeota bacterium]MBJ7615077.1 hypothetical protein [Candidatus Dormibacteraeota bacterium]